MEEALIDTTSRLFTPISLAEMEQVRLMNRIDTKYVTTPENLLILLQSMQDDYFIQEVEGFRNSHYRTLYYDTDQLEMYMAHQDGRCMREKIRMRDYLDSHLTFLEVKDKNNKGRTSKKRIRFDGTDNLSNNPEALSFLHLYSHYNPHALKRQVENRFNRITLVNKGLTERLTIDTDIHFRNLATGIEQTLPQLVIIELKQDGLCPSFAKEQLREMHIHPAGISKYCLGSILTHPGIKYNRFKKKIRKIDKLTKVTPWIY